MAKKKPSNSQPGRFGDAKTTVPAAATAFRSPVGCTGETPGERDFETWCKEQRVRFPSSHLTVLPATGRALVASRAIKMGEVVVEVPDDAVLMADNCSIHDILEEEGMCKPAEDEILEVQGLIIAVMFEKWRGPESHWAPYLALLPDDMTHMPLYWKRREFLELRGTAAYDKMMGRVQHPADAPTQVPLLWCEVVEPFISEHPELELPDGERGYELYRWATCAVASYSFILGDDKYQAMVPVWDLLNHITGAVNVRLNHCAKRHVLQMIATRDIRQGEELVNSYGELSNAELLRGYGFVERVNGNNHAQVPLSFLLRGARQLLADEEPCEQAAAHPTAAAGSNGPSTDAAARSRSGAAAGPGPGSSISGGGGGKGALRPEAAPGDRDPATVRRLVAGRLRLGRRLGLLPQHHIFKVFKDRPPPAAMTALAYLLTCSEAQAAAVRTQAKASLVASGSAGAGSRTKKAKGEGAAAAAVTATTAVKAVAAVLSGDAAAEARIVRLYKWIASYMLVRYGDTLEEDVRLMARFGELPPRQQAALLARMPEKEALVWVREEVGRKGAVRRSLKSGVVATPGGKVQVAAGSAGTEGEGATGEGVKGAAAGDEGQVAGPPKPTIPGNTSFAFGFSL